MSAKIIAITGANSGIGRATALELARQGATIILICRNEERGKEAQQFIKQQSSNNNIFLELCDLSWQEDIRRCGLRMRATYSHIDVLINNAGALFGSHKLTKDGLERTFALNHMGYFLLTHYLLDLVKRGRVKRIVNVASVAHWFTASIPWGDLQAKHRKYQQFSAYGLSKLFNIYFTKVLAKRLKKSKTGITVNCLHPGMVYTGFGKTGTDWFTKLVKVGGPLLDIPEKGARTSVYLATSPEVEEVTGTYYARLRKAILSPKARSKASAKRLWEKSMELANINVYGKVEPVEV